MERRKLYTHWHKCRWYNNKTMGNVDRSTLYWPRPSTSANRSPGHPLCFRLRFEFSPNKHSTHVTVYAYLGHLSGQFYDSTVFIEITKQKFWCAYCMWQACLLFTFHLQTCLLFTFHLHFTVSHFRFLFICMFRWTYHSMWQYSTKQCGSNDMV